MRKALFFSGALLYAAILSAKVSLTSIWGDNMVLQQKSAVVFTGNSTIGKKVSANAHGMEKPSMQTVIRMGASL